MNIFCLFPMDMVQLISTKNEENENEKIKPNTAKTYPLSNIYFLLHSYIKCVLFIRYH